MTTEQRAVERLKALLDKWERPYQSLTVMPDDLVAIATIVNAQPIVTTDGLVERCRARSAEMQEVDTLAHLTLYEAADRIASLERALTPFAKLADEFTDCIVEICESHPENPSPHIQPFDTKHFREAKRLSTTNRLDDE